MQIKTDKITLRDFNEKDLELFRNFNTGRHKWMDFDGPYYGKLSAREIERKILLYRTEKDSPRKRLAIIDKETDKLIGLVSRYWQSKETNWLSLGITIFDENYWSCGFGFSALKAWINYIFSEDQSLVRLDLRTWSGNKRMVNLAKKLGFTQEACFRKARIVNSKYYDGLGMGILKEEWKY